MGCAGEIEQGGTNRLRPNGYEGQEVTKGCWWAPKGDRDGRAV